MLIRISLVTLGTLLAGVLLGMVPFVKDHLHWNIWSIVPVSGALFGAAISYAQALGGQALGLRMSRGQLYYLAAVCAVAYFATDVGIYLTEQVHLQGRSDVPDGDYALWRLISFGTFLESRLGSSVLVGALGERFELGGTATRFSYFVDLLGAAMAAYGTLSTLQHQSAYCEHCRATMRLVRTRDHYPRQDDAGLTEATATLKRLASAGEPNALSTWLESMPTRYESGRLIAKLRVMDFRCPSCGASVIAGTVFVSDGRGWVERAAERFRVAQRSPRSATGEVRDA